MFTTLDSLIKTFLQNLTTCLFVSVSVYFCSESCSHTVTFLPWEVTLHGISAGRKMRLLAVIIYPIGERVVFCAEPRTASFPVMYVVREAIIQNGSLRKIQRSLREPFLQVLAKLLFTSPTIISPDFVAARSTTDAATTTKVAEQFSTCVSGRHIFDFRVFYYSWGPF